MIRSSSIPILTCVLIMLSLSKGQFGLNMVNKKTDDTQQNQMEGPSSKGTPQMEDLDKLDLNDAELLEAFQELANLSPEEMEETMKELVGMLGDDPETLAAIEEVMKEIPNMKVTDIQSTANDLIAEDEVTAATQDALKMLGRSKWETIWEKQDLILEAVILSGQINEEDIALYKSNKSAWEKELRFIWNELQKQVEAERLGNNEL